MINSRPQPGTIAAPVRHELVIKKSRFLAHVAPVTTTADADAVIAAIRKEHWEARHHCTAMVLGFGGDQARSSDDGEPSGTAGVPMLEVLKRRELTDVVAVVSRWFGGTKLGAGGLVRAYSSAVAAALDAATPIRREVLTRVRLEVSHAEAGSCDNLIRQWTDEHPSQLDAPSYGERVTLQLWVRPADLDQLRADLASASAGELDPLIGPERIVDVPG
ncbi:IMPACT family protein [Propionibacteriaceae bacterium Y1685]